MADKTTFLHLLLFRCGQCSLPVAKSVFNNKSTLEDLNAVSLSVQCECGWCDEPTGMEAVRHWVLAWSPVGRKPEASDMQGPSQRTKIDANS
jgi:hypothetical protein